MYKSIYETVYRITPKQFIQKKIKCFNNLNVIIIPIITPPIRFIPINNMFYKIFVALELFSIFIKDSNLQYKRFQVFFLNI